MQTMRSRLSCLVAGWLTLQLAGLAAAPIVLRAAVAHNVDAGCTCPDAKPGQACPMHRQHSSGRGHDGAGGAGHDGVDGATRCGMRSAFNEPDAALIAFTGTGVMPRRDFVPRVLTSAEPVFSLQSVLSTRSELPESPPPRHRASRT